MDELWNKLAQELSGKIAELIIGIVSPMLDVYFRGAVKLTFSEEEAANLLNVSTVTLASWRKNKTINHYQYFRQATYGLHHLQDFLQRNEHKNLPPLFEIKRQISLLGIETEPTKRNRDK